MLHRGVLMFTWEYKENNINESLNETCGIHGPWFWVGSGTQVRPL